MKKTLFITSLCLASAGWAIELSPASLSAKTPLVVQQPAPGLSAPVPNSKTPQVELLNPGVEPRQQLRLKPAINVQETTVMTVKMDMDISASGQSSAAAKIPVSVMTFETKVTKIAPNGDIYYEFAYTNADIVGDTRNTQPAALNAMRSALKNMVGVKGSFIMDNRGFHKGGDIILPEGADNNVKQMVRQMSNSIEQLASPLPAEAVGKGAKWRVSSSSDFSGINVKDIATYELASWQDGVASMNVSIEQQANPQNITSPQLPAGTTLTLKSFASQGRGAATMRLDRLIPFRSTVSISSNSEMSAKTAGSSQESTIKTKMAMEMTLESK
ncbi:hypothetical protein [Microcoleus vaginatus]|uniref:hypothetical protein n=1 Tax=Microcoleus vaginatus TaxID=119532 RepID=UPI0016897368|nr:hypothetical protein [Microcoleus sp. FACHB-DQ6]MBD1887191.1 hypothetical protein [Microcoleus sp. FACHB-84]MBD2009685.1 hypothetical protein [Microcoleus sp. FACHB-45]